MKEVYEIIEAEQKKFNQKYGVNFDIYEFDGILDALNEDDDVVAGDALSNDADPIYRTTFIDLYKKAYGKFVDRRIGDTFDFVEMLDDFENNIMSPYRTIAASNKVTSDYGGWTTVTYMKSVKNYLDNIPDNNVKFAEERYKAGKLPIREMRAYANSLKKLETPPSAGQLATLKCYAEALTNVNNGRKLRWIIFNLPRYLSEIIEAKNFNKAIDKLIPSAPNGGENSDMYEQVNTLLNDRSIEKSRAIINDKLNEIAPEVENVNESTVKKEHVVIDEIDDKKVKRNFDKRVEKSAPSKDTLNF